MLNPSDVSQRLREHFDTVSDEGFVENLRRFTPDLALAISAGDLWQRALLAERHLPGNPVRARALLVTGNAAVPNGDARPVRMRGLRQRVTRLLESHGFAVSPAAVQVKAGTPALDVDVVVYLDTGAGHADVPHPDLPSLSIRHGEEIGAEVRVRGSRPPRFSFTYRTAADLDVALPGLLIPVRRLAEQHAVAGRSGVTLVGARIRFFRELQGLTREDLVGRVPSLTTQGLARIEETPDDVSNPELSLLRHIALVLNTTVAQLVEPTPMDLSVLSFAPLHRSVA